jgi:SHS2 domain-containing protein
VPERVSELALVENGLRAVVDGRRGTPKTLVKAVTYHRLELAPGDGGWLGRVVLDV